MITVMTVALMMTWVVPELVEELKKVDINIATPDELMTLEGIGKQVARNIIEYSKTNGPFQHPTDLMKVKGVGPKLFNAIKDRIIIQEVSSIIVD